MNPISEPGTPLSHQQRSLEHFRGIYKTLDPGEIARRCALPFDGEVFSLRILGTEYRVPFPEFELLPPPGDRPPRDDEGILFLRYLCEGRYAEPAGRQLSYREIPWGEVYYYNFERRCIRRLAYAFGGNLERFRQVMEGSPGLRAERLDRGKPNR